MVFKDPILGIMDTASRGPPPSVRPINFSLGLEPGNRKKNQGFLVQMCPLWSEAAEKINVCKSMAVIWSDEIEKRKGI